MGEIRDVTGSNNAQSFKEALLDTLTEVFDKDPGTNIEKFYQLAAEQLATVDIETAAVKHDNFISVAVQDEILARENIIGDRLQFEGAFVIDRIGIVPTGFIRTESKIINQGTTKIVLSHIPEDPDNITVTFSAADDRAEFTAVDVLSFNSEKNEIEITAIPTTGQYQIQYIDNGNTLEALEEHDVPLGEFALGFGENGFSFFGFGE